MVFNPELRLLELSIVKTGWVQPLLVSRDMVVIDGFHRLQLVLQSKALQQRYQGKVPCAVLDLSPAEAMLLTVRINRAKGNHVAVRMSELVRALVNEHGLELPYIAKEIGGTLDEVNLLLLENVFKIRDIQNHKYSKAWKPVEVPDQATT